MSNMLRVLLCTLLIGVACGEITGRVSHRTSEDGRVACAYAVEELHGVCGVEEGLFVLITPPFDMESYVVDSVSAGWLWNTTERSLNPLLGTFVLNNLLLWGGDGSVEVVILGESLYSGHVSHSVEVYCDDTKVWDNWPTSSFDVGLGLGVLGLSLWFVGLMYVTYRILRLRKAPTVSHEVLVDEDV